MTKKEEKTLRTKYLRNLEKFFNSAISTLKKENFDEAKFKERMLKNAKFFENNPVVNLNSSYAKNLEIFVNTCLDFSKKKNELLVLANALDKRKKKKEKKEKHKNYLKEYE